MKIILILLLCGLPVMAEYEVRYRTYDIQTTGSLKTNGCSYFFPKDLNSKKIEDRVAKIVKKSGEEIYLSLIHI